MEATNGKRIKGGVEVVQRYADRDGTTPIAGTYNVAVGGRFVTSVYRCGNVWRSHADHTFDAVFPDRDAAVWHGLAQHGFSVA